MIWPIHFGIMTLAILSLAGYTKDKSDTPAGKGKVMATVIMAICLIIQIIDISPAMERKHDAFLACSTSSGEEPFADNVLLRSGGWHYLADRVDEVVFMPPTGETISTDPFWTCTFIEYAMENDISLSATYCSRNLSDANDAYAVKRLSSQDDAVLFVLYDDHYENVDIPSGLNLYRFEGLVIATREDMWGFPGFDRP